MGVLEAAARIVQLGGRADRAPHVASLRKDFEHRTGAFSPDDPWFEERIRAFWSDAVTRGRFGREVEGELDEAERVWLGPLERAHRGLFRLRGGGGRGAAGAETLADVWSGAEFEVTLVDETGTRAELQASVDADRVEGGQLFDGRVVAGAVAGVVCVALLPGPVFHPRDATAPIQTVLGAARARGMGATEVLDALLRMERSFRSLSRVKASYAYRPEGLAPPRPADLASPRPVRREAKAPR